MVFFMSRGTRRFAVCSMCGQRYLALTPETKAIFDRALSLTTNSVRNNMTTKKALSVLAMIAFVASVAWSTTGPASDAKTQARALTTQQMKMTTGGQYGSGGSGSFTWICPPSSNSSCNVCKIGKCTFDQVTPGINYAIEIIPGMEVGGQLEYGFGICRHQFFDGHRTGCKYTANRTRCISVYGQGTCSNSVNVCSYWKSKCEKNNVGSACVPPACNKIPDLFKKCKGC